MTDRRAGLADRNAGLDASVSSLNSIDDLLDNDTSVPSSANIDTQTSKWPSTSSSMTASPVQSRDASPTSRQRGPSRTSADATASRRGNVKDPSPPRRKLSLSTPSLSSRQQNSPAATPVLPTPSSSGPVLRSPVPQKPLVASETSRDAPRWPISPRLKSPPPSLARTTPGPSTRQQEQEPPVINVQRATPSPNPEPTTTQPASDSEAEDHRQAPGMRTPTRGPSNGSTGASATLETVQEVSQPNTPGLDADATSGQLEQSATPEGSAPGARGATTDTQPGSSVQSSQNTTSTTNTTNSESGSDSGSVKAGTRRPRAPAPAPPLQTRQSSSALKFGKRGQTSGESSSRNMTVETEEVRNVPQTSLVASAVGPGPGGSLRTRPSTETIKPRKEKKKHARKPASVASGNASSKADIFEAKVASAVEEADSSDSDETFVYDSNPPDADRPRRYHSRTPSATSMISQLDRGGMRSIHGVLETAAHNLPAKRNMKFVNTNSGGDSLHGDDEGRGTGGRSNAGSARGTGRHHHHPPRWGRNNGNHHLSLFDNESPFPHAARSKLSGSGGGGGGASTRASPNPPSSPRFSNRGWLSQGKRQMTLPGYDMDDATTGADDERTPLLNVASVRSSRSRNRRAPPLRNVEAQSYPRHPPSFLNRFASCLVLTVMLLLVITGAIGFMFATSQPLTDIRLVRIGNVLASEQELMMDVTVRAHNPNVVVVMIDSADLEVFAKSPHAGSDSEWWRHPHGELDARDDPRDDQPGFDDSPADDSSPMRLGNILALDSPLTYEGSFFQSGISTSTGELRLAHPGNGTDSGTERWERIISDNFTLIVKGVLKYTLPLSQRIRSVPIEHKTTVRPDLVDEPLPARPNRTEVGIS